MLENSTAPTNTKWIKEKSYIWHLYNLLDSQRQRQKPKNKNATFIELTSTLYDVNTLNENDISNDFRNGFKSPFAQLNRQQTMCTMKQAKTRNDEKSWNLFLRASNAFNNRRILRFPYMAYVRFKLLPFIERKSFWMGRERKREKKRKIFENPRTHIIHAYE